MKALISFVLSLSLAACAATPFPASAAEVDLAVRLEFIGGGICSGTPVGPNTILTAEHCVSKGMRGMLVDSDFTVVTRVETDGNDHALVVTAKRYSNWAKFGRTPRVGDKLRIYGNPAGIEDMYREGLMVLDDGEGFDRTWFVDMNMWHGDSGAALFNARGQIAATVTGYIYETNPRSGATWVMGLALPWAFTAQQWSDAGVASDMPSSLR